MTGAGHVQIRCPVAGFVHLAHLSRRGDRVARLDQQRRAPAPRATAASSRGCPTPRRSRSSAPCARAAANRSRSGRTPRGSTARRRARTRRKPLAPMPNSTGSACSHGSHGPGRAAAEVRRHVLDHQRRDQVGPRRRQTPRVQPAHRVPDQRRRAAQLVTASPRSATNRSVLIGWGSATSRPRCHGAS